MHYSTLFLSTFALVPLVSAHGKILSVTGNAGGNGTALGIRGGIVPSSGGNALTEVDVTIFEQRKVECDGFGRTPKFGQNKAEDLKRAMELSGEQLPQVKLGENGGSVEGRWRVVTGVSLTAILVLKMCGHNLTT